MTPPMWKGRFAKATADLVQQYGESISYDWRMYRHDIAGSIAHARAQVKAGTLTDDEFSAIEQGLREIEKDIEAGNFEFSIELEDIHMNIESALTDKIGAAGAKLHTARSRNDQVATDTRLYCREEIDTLTTHLKRKKYSQIKSKGVKQAPFYVLLGAQMPSILVETSFISNPRECKRLVNPKYQERLCEGIVLGVKKYIKDTNSTAFVDERPAGGSKG